MKALGKIIYVGCKCPLSLKFQFYFLFNSEVVVKIPNFIIFLNLLFVQFALFYLFIWPHMGQLLHLVHMIESKC